MEQKTSKKSLPSTVLKLYVRLYCKRRKYSKNKMMEAIKSWVTLSNCEKEQFKRLYEECQLNHKKKLADYLRKTQPYLKKKEQIITTKQEHAADLEVVTSTTEAINNDDSEQNGNIHDLLATNSIVEPSSDMGVLETYGDDNTTLEPHQQNGSSLSHEQHPVDILAEPEVPSIRTARELFETIKSRNTESTETWAALSSIQKSRYRKAVSLLKDDYLRKFKAHLESLPSKQLFNYYVSYFDGMSC